MDAANKPRENFPSFIFDEKAVPDLEKRGKINCMVATYRFVISRMEVARTAQKPSNVADMFWGGWCSGHLEANRSLLENLLFAIQDTCKGFPNSYKEVTTDPPEGIQ